MLRENLSFWVRGDDGVEYGPVALEELREWVKENRAGLGTEVRLDEPGSPWQPWQHYPELVALLAAVQSTVSLPGMPGVSVAPIWRRITAWVIDIFIFAIFLSPVQLLLGQIMPMNEILQATANPTLLQTMPTPLLYQVVAFVIIDNACLVLYFTICHATYGRTLAKALLHIRVVAPSGDKPTWIKAFVRAVALIFSVNLMFPLLLVFLNPQRRALHDLVADTCVIGE